MNLDRRLFRLARDHRLLLALTIGLGFAAGVFTVLQAGLLSRTVNRVFLGEWNLEQVSGLMGGLLAVIAARAVLAWGSEVASNALAVRIKTRLRAMLYDHLLALGPAYTRGERTGEITSAAVEGVEALDAYFSQYLPQLALAALVPLTFLTFVFPIDWLSGVVLLVTAPLIPLFMILIGQGAAALTRRQWQTLSRMSAYFLDVIQGLPTLKMLGRGQAQVDVLAQISDRFRQVTMSVLRVTFLSAFALEMISTLSTAVVAVEIGLRLLYGRLEFEQAFFVLLLAPEFYLPIRMLGTRFHAGMAGIAAARRLFEILETPASSPDTEVEGQAVTPLDLQPPSITFERVSFTYPDGREALRDVSFEIPSGGTVALVGPSGAGKSTLAGLLLGLYRPTGGRILVDGQPLGQDGLSPAAWRERVAWVPQNPYLFKDTIAANLRLARPEAGLEVVIDAARLAHAHEFISALPEGYETQAGERGARLSGGQAQRLALARAFLKDAPALVLDEATANLDPEHEAWLGESLSCLLPGRTALMIAHRLNTIAAADRIIVLDAGQVVESGTHAELLQGCGLYARLVQAQDGSVAANASGAVHPLPPALKADRTETPHPPAARPASQALAAKPHPTPPLLRLLRLAAPFTRLIVLSVLAGFATIGSSIGLMTASAYIISAAALHPSIAELQMAIVGVRFFGIARGLFRYLERYLSHQTTFHLLARLRVWFYRALEPLAPARLAGYHSGDLLARILGDIAALENFYVRVVAPPLVAVLTAAAAALILGRFDLPLAGALLAFLLLGGVGVPLLVRRLGREPGQAAVHRRAELNAALVDSIQGLPDLLVYNQAQAQASKLNALSLSLAQAQQRMARLTGLQTALEGLLANLAAWTVLGMGVGLVAAGRMEGVYLAVVVLAALTSFEAVQPLPLAAQHLETDLAAARRLFEVVDAEPEVRGPENPRPLPENPRPLPENPRPLPEQPDLEVRGLSFRYPPAWEAGSDGSLPAHSPADRPYALCDLSFRLQPGRRLALVGSSGAGKSTLVNLLLRFWEYREGEIRLGGHDLRSYTPDDLRRALGVVSQSTYLFNASVADNLRLARPKATEADLERAARDAQLHDFITALPQGYATWIGEQGLRLSGGERQRLAIARALLKAPSLLILDEPTANLDPQTGREVLSAIRRLMQGRTTLLITHQLAGLEDFDEILVLHQGQVVERGRHAELLSAGGRYRQLWDLQHGWV